MRWVSATLWRVVGQNPWGIRGSPDAKETIGLGRLSAELTSWCDDEQVPHDRRICELTAKMLGGSSADCTLHSGHIMKVKASECGVLLGFGVGCLEKHVGIPYREDLLLGGRALLEYLDLVRTTGSQPTGVQCNRMTSLVVEHLLCSERALIHFSPKHHLLFHLARRTVLCNWYKMFLTRPADRASCIRLESQPVAA